jgi:hypothetical protein
MTDLVSIDSSLTNTGLRLGYEEMGDAGAVGFE